MVEVLHTTDSAGLQHLILRPHAPSQEGPEKPSSVHAHQAVTGAHYTRGAPCFGQIWARCNSNGARSADRRLFITNAQYSRQSVLKECANSVATQHAQLSIARPSNQDSCSAHTATASLHVCCCAESDSGSPGGPICVDDACLRGAPRGESTVPPSVAQALGEAR